MNTTKPKLALVGLALLLLAGLTIVVLLKQKVQPQPTRTASTATSVSELLRWLDYQHPRGLTPQTSSAADWQIAKSTLAVKLDPSDTDAYGRRAYAYWENAEFEKAISDFNMAIQLDPMSGSSFYARGLLHHETGAYDKAINDLTSAIRLIPSEVLTTATNVYATLLRARGDCYLKTGETDNAVADFTEAIRFNPREAAGFASRGDAWYQKGNFGKAVEDYRSALQIEPDMTSTLNELAWLLATCPDASIRNGGEAVGFARKACELSEWKEAHIIDTLAAACAEAGDFEGAVKFQQQMLAMNGLADTERAEAQLRLDLFRQKKPFREQAGQR